MKGRLLAAILYEIEAIKGLAKARFEVSRERHRDVVGLMSSLGCSVIQISPGNLSGNTVYIEIGLLRLGIEAANQSLLLEHSDTISAVCFSAQNDYLDTTVLGSPQLYTLSAGTSVMGLMVSKSANNKLAYGVPDQKQIIDLPIHSYRAFKDSLLIIASATQYAVGSSVRCHTTFECPRVAVLTMLEFLASRLVAVISDQDEVIALRHGPLLRMLEMARARPTIRVEELASRLGMTRRNLHYFTTRELGVAPKQLIKSVLLRHAMSDLQTSERHRTIGDIAFDYGFEDFSGFCADYRRMFGEKPGDTRRRANVDVAS